MLLGLLPIVCSILVTGMAKRATFTDYPEKCPTLKNLQPLDLPTAKMNGTWYETLNNNIAGYMNSYYTHRRAGEDNITSTFFADFKTPQGCYAPNTIQLLWELKNSLNERARGAACTVTQGNIIQGPYWFCEVTKDDYIAYSCDDNGTETLHVATKNKSAKKEDFKERILNCGIPESLYNQLNTGSSTDICPK